MLLRYADLNGDSMAEIFVYCRVYSGTGGYAYLILSPAAKDYVHIGHIQGEITLLEAVNGWLQLEGRSRNGGNSMTRFLLQFDGREYCFVRNEDHNYIENRVTIRKIGPED